MKTISFMIPDDMYALIETFAQEEGTSTEVATGLLAYFGFDVIQQVREVERRNFKFLTLSPYMVNEWWRERRKHLKKS